MGGTKTDIYFFASFSAKFFSQSTGCSWAALERNGIQNIPFLMKAASPPTHEPISIILCELFFEIS